MLFMMSGLANACDIRRLCTMMTRSRLGFRKLFGWKADWRRNLLCSKVARSMFVCLFVCLFVCFALLCFGLFGLVWIRFVCLLFPTRLAKFRVSMFVSHHLHGILKLGQMIRTKACKGSGKITQTNFKAEIKASPSAGPRREVLT